MSERPAGILKRAVAFSTSPPSSFISARSTGVPARPSGPAQSPAMPAQSPSMPAQSPAKLARTQPAVPAGTRPIGASLETAPRSRPPLEDTDSDGDTASIVELPSDQVGTGILKKAFDSQLAIRAKNICKFSSDLDARNGANYHRFPFP
jgi:hypothetical protein